MGKVYPSFSSSSSPSSPHPSLSDYISSEREVFTVWMKSLIMNSNGCTVYDSKGQIVYRVDNYNCKCKAKVYLMDLSGKVLFKILKKKLRLFGRWEGYRCNGSEPEELRPGFTVKNPCRILKGDHPSCEVWDNTGLHKCYKVDGLASKSTYQIIDMAGGLVAEVKRKQTTSGVVLGDDVLTLVVEPNIDHSLVMGLVIVYGLMNHSM